ncbi:Copper chaperone CopZ [Arthrobacter sp. SO5]|uniref:heavy-metal-associated domain-containing protein n=1 Tax=Arthrobacter sp. SO5 TaxID=1897055 RepID=UPI001E32AC43|nr:cation transporter [Arthrobacter sp. SO5]MCB5275986.1 Copper chaperone CopZ [Arthrobacter sp. SO5]
MRNKHPDRTSPHPPEQSGCGCCPTGARTLAPLAAGGPVHSLEGLTCGHCVQTVETAVASADGVESATVELVAGGTSCLTVAGTARRDAVPDAVTGAAYRFTPGQ